VLILCTKAFLTVVEGGETWFWIYQ